MRAALPRLAEQAGVRIFEETPVVSIDPAGVRKRIVTPAARMRAYSIVLAGNVHLGTLFPRLARTLLPVWRYAAVTEPLGRAARARRSTIRGAVSESSGIDHYRIVDGDRLMWAGPVTTWNGNPRRFASGIERHIRAVFPQLGNGEGRRRLQRRDGRDRARHAADRPVAPRPLGRQRIWPAGALDLGDGGAADRAEA